MSDKNPLLPDGLDVSWNVVWYSATTLPGGIRVREMKIPYSMLQFLKNQEVILKEGRGYTPGSSQYYVPLFGARNISYLDLTLRETLSSGNRFSIQQCTQLFATQGLYNNLRISVDPDCLADFPKRRIFNDKDLRPNSVTRWKYQPGSNLHLVWMYSRTRRGNMNPLRPRERRRKYKTCQNNFPIFSGYLRTVTSDGKFIVHFINTMIV